MIKRKKFLAIGVIVLITFGIIIYFTDYANIKYDTSDAVTYFDEQGRYQLVNSVNQDYAIYDAEKGKIISDFLLYYIKVDAKVYFITNPSRQSVAYAVLDTTENQFIQFYDLNSFDENEKEILEHQDDMIDLTKERSNALKNILKFIPQKWRKW